MTSNRVFLLALFLSLLNGCGGGGSGGGGPDGSGDAPNNSSSLAVTQYLVSLTVTPNGYVLPTGENHQFTATGVFSDNTSYDLTSLVTWTTSNPDVATVSAIGLATSVAAGEAAITAVSGGVSGTTVLTVTSAELISLDIEPKDQSIAQGFTVQFSVMGTYSDNTTRDLTPSAGWTSSNPVVATISNAGIASSGTAGTTTITASSGGVASSTSLTVTPATLTGTVADGGSGSSGEGNGARNLLALSVNGPACTNTLNGGYINKPCVSVTVCSPGTSTCQTINDILLDTGSTGLRVFKQALSVSLTPVTASGSGALANCIQYGDGSSQWGPVKMAGVILGNEPAVQVPIHVIDAGFGTRPTGCKNAETNPSDAGFNGILGVSFFAQDCGPACVAMTNNRMYYSCRNGSCSGTTVALSSQIQNPVALLPVDNNGVIVKLPSVPPGGAVSVDGQLVLGIGTQPNNAPSEVTVYSANWSGYFTTLFNDTTYRNSFIDSGSNGLFIPAPESLLPVCTIYSSWFCPDSTRSLTATNIGTGGAPSGIVSFQIGNTVSLTQSPNKVFAEIGGPVPDGFDFDWGLPFFFGRDVYVGIEGKASILGSGPYWAY